jgi:molybdopterin-guanine dinucleotide biosynthesis protein A
MGRPKALLPVAGTTLVEWLADRLAPGFADLLVSARAGSDLPPALRGRVVLDLRDDAGPLAGIEAGLAACPTPALVAVACDMPWVSPELCGRLVATVAGHDAAVPRLQSGPEPTCAAYARSALTGIRAALEDGRLRAREVLSGLDVAWLDGEAAGQFDNLNRPEDYERFLDAVR